MDASALAVYPSTLNLAIGLISASAIVTPQTVQANAGVRLGADGFVNKRQGNASSVYVSTGLHFDLAGTFTGTYYVQFDLLTSTTTFGSPIISGTGQRYPVSPSGALVCSCHDRHERRGRCHLRRDDPRLHRRAPTRELQR